MAEPGTTPTTEILSPKQRFLKAGRQVITLVEAARLEESLGGVTILAPGVREAISAGMNIDGPGMVYLVTNYPVFEYSMHAVPSERRAASAEAILDQIISRLPVFDRNA